MKTMTQMDDDCSYINIILQTFYCPLGRLKCSYDSFILSNIHKNKDEMHQTSPAGLPYCYEYAWSYKNRIFNIASSFKNFQHV